MDKFVVTGIPPFDGEYPIDVSAPYTMRDYNIIKRMSGVRAGELNEALAAGDSDVLLAIAVIAVRRAGRNWQQFQDLAWEATEAQIEFIDMDRAVVEDPPEAPTSERKQPDSGATSDADGEWTPEKNLRGIGSLESAAG